MLIHERLRQLRALMKQEGVDYFYIPAADAHFNEHVPFCWQRRTWISGFTGSAGDVLVGQDCAILWTDGRYTLQASQQLDGNLFEIILRQQGASASLTYWLKEHAKNICLALDPRTVSYDQYLEIETTIAQLGGRIHFYEQNPIDLLRGDDSQARFDSPILALPEIYTGKAAQTKIRAVQAELSKHDVSGLCLTSLDEIAWLLNVRAGDIAYNPLVVSYALVTQQGVIWFVGKTRVLAANLSAYCQEQGIQVADYDDFFAYVSAFDGKLWLDPGTVSCFVSRAIADTKKYFAPSPIPLTKAVKNKVELEGAQAAHKVDAVALIRFIHWLESHWQEGVSEYSAMEKLHDFRAKNPAFRGESFTTISGFGPNGAIIHYAVTPASSRQIDDTSLYLVDSGAQYFQGTTDVTRTLHFGSPTAEERRHYTLVLKGHLALRHTPFPRGTTGAHIDALARAALWREGYNYLHGTGHGVGAYLCVHEGPQVISPRYNAVPLQMGMIVSNEPGLYIQGQHGIRIENLCYVGPAENPAVQASDSGPFYQLIDLTLVPYARKLIDKDLLTPEELRQIDRYHQQVYQLISPLLEEAERSWLEAETAPLS